MRYRPMDTDPADPRLGRYVPDDWRHVDSYPLSALEAPPTRVPVVIGVNWYAEMDKPAKDERSGELFLARDKKLSRIRGGHCVCLEPGEGPDQTEWQKFYDQGQEGACVGFGWSRAMSILNGGKYAARWLWSRAKEKDEWPETKPGDNEGTSVRAAGEQLVALGHVPWQESYAADDYQKRFGYKAEAQHGIAAFRWAKTVDEVHAVLGNKRADELGAVPILNSWGTGYPIRVWLPDEVFARLISEDGEIAVPTDR
ncbi:hypothetical protein Lesp02_75540 [Lentzea sp. NBRC 105346]|uniref:hypothetical protein n=1 Tax=Lentzea sp. NBRC 105346 TaxID=3032205 RepID=UPI0024A58509|nr:hypothetical protein [Lentzea sp. NBRC 105346]GLZ35367.1 hypothetical protein Lesp02_75540 [Lentzea sp. NBRC 105346]